MQCTAPASTPATTSPPSLTAPGPLVVAPNDLVAAFATIPDPRRRQGTRFTLPAILALAVVAILANHLSVLAIAEWGAEQRRELLVALGFPDGVTPHQSTLQRLFRKLDPMAFSAALSRVFAPAAARARGSQGVAIDGKAQRGRLAFDAAGCPVHALSAFCHEHGVVLAQVPIEARPEPAAPAACIEKAEAAARPEPAAPAARIEKAEAELTVAPRLIARLDWQGRVLTGDALFCQRAICEQVLARGGDYLLLVKENQPTLYDDLRLLFDPPMATLPLTDRREVRTVDHGHGRHHDTRHLIASTDLVGYSDWPGLAQVFRLERTWRERGKHKQEVRYGITSLPPAIAGAARLLELKRGHWQIENRLHYVKDETLGEDRSLIHQGKGPMVMAVLRDTVVSLLHRAGFRAIASRLRYHSAHPEVAVALLRGQNA